MQTKEESGQVNLQIEEEDFIVLQALSPEQQKQLYLQRVQQLSMFYATNKQYEISSWYPTLEQFTFKSIKTQLLAIDAYLIYWMYYNDQDVAKLQRQQKQLYQYYLKLLNKINHFLQKDCKQFLKSEEIQCFMKLATRSPKDLGYKYSPHEIQTISQMLAQNLKLKFPHLHKKSTQQLSYEFINQIYRFFLDLSKDKVKVKNANDFMQIFSSSQRIIIDISDFSFLKEQVFDEFSKRNYSRAEENFVQVWARQWQDFHWFQELRCFYNDYKLTAVCQYDQRCFFPELKQKSKLIQDQVTKFFQSLKPSLEKLGLSKGVMDLVMFGIEIEMQIQIKLIEINVFNHNSRASLFSWEKDLNVLRGNGDQKIEIRILTEPKQINRNQVTRVMGMIEKGTDAIIEKTMAQLGLQQLWNNFS